MTSTASSTTSRSVGTRIDSTSPPLPCAARPISSAGLRRDSRCTQSLRAARPLSESGEGGCWGVGNVEQRIELGQLKERPQIFIETGEAEFPIRLPDLPRERHQHPETGGVDVAGVGEIDQ